MRECLRVCEPKELVIIRSHVGMLLEALPADQEPLEELVSFVADVLAAHEGLAEAAARARAATAIEDLRDALAMCYRPRGENA